ncbi:MAG: VWA domain-containing protein [Planctomycetota bacterium]|nr:VWA domain-containing protein [Planctomycetota bacterium]
MKTGPQATTSDDDSDDEPIDVDFSPSSERIGFQPAPSHLGQVVFDPVVQASAEDLFAAVEFADNPEPRCPCVLVVDISGSMAGLPIDQLNQALKQFVKDVSSDTLAAKRLELAVVSCGGDVRVAHDFATVNQFVPPILMAGGDTPLGQAVERALELIDVRKRNYRLGGVSYYRPWLILLTDGSPTDDMRQAARKLNEAESTKSLVAFCFGTDTFDKERMAKVFPRAPLTMRGARYREFFQWLSASMASLSHSRPGDRLQLQKPSDDWVID